MLMYNRFIGLISLMTLSASQALCQTSGGVQPTQAAPAPATTSQGAPGAKTLSNQEQWHQQKHHKHRQDRREGQEEAALLHLEPNAPTWQKYLQAAEGYKYKKDTARAKAYYLEALRQLEALPPQSRAFSPRIGLLEDGLISCYPKKSSPTTGPNSLDKEVKVDQEELAVLARLHQLDQIYVSPSGTNLKLTDTEYKKVSADLAKDKTAQQQAAAGSSK